MDVIELTSESDHSESLIVIEESRTRLRCEPHHEDDTAERNDQPNQLVSVSNNWIGQKASPVSTFTRDIQDMELPDSSFDTNLDNPMSSPRFVNKHIRSSRRSSLDTSIIILDSDASEPLQKNIVYKNVSNESASKDKLNSSFDNIMRTSQLSDISELIPPSQIEKKTVTLPSNNGFLKEAVFSGDSSDDDIELPTAMIGKHTKSVYEKFELDSRESSMKVSSLIQRKAKETKLVSQNTSPMSDFAKRLFSHTEKRKNDEGQLSALLNSKKPKRSHSECCDALNVPSPNQSKKLLKFPGESFTEEPNTLPTEEKKNELKRSSSINYRPNSKEDFKQSVKKASLYNIYSDVQLDDYLKNVKLSNPKLLQEVNKILKSKAEFLPSVEVCFAKSLEESLFTGSFTSEIFAPMKHGEVISQYPLIIWKRKIRAEYLSSKHIFVPVPNYTFTERSVGLYYDAPSMMRNLENNSFPLIFEGVKREIGDDIKIILILDGLENYFQKIKSSSNQVYKEAVLRQLSNLSQDVPISNKKSKSTTPSYSMTVEEILEALSDFSVVYGVRIFPIKGVAELCDWLKSFAFAMAQSVTEKSHLYDDFENIGTIKSGSSAFNTFVESLKQIKGVTEPSAKKTCEATVSLQRLLITLKKSQEPLTDQTGKKILRQDCETRLRKLLLSMDPDDLVNG